MLSPVIHINHNAIKHKNLLSFWVQNSCNIYILALQDAVFRIYIYIYIYVHIYIYIYIYVCTYVYIFGRISVLTKTFGQTLLAMTPKNLSIFFTCQMHFLRFNCIFFGGFFLEKYLL